MFGLFRKKEASDPGSRLASLAEGKDWAGLAKAYHELGAAAMDRGDLDKAQLWLHRADTIYSAEDEIYDGVGSKIVDDCSDRIGRLEDEDTLFYNAIPAEIEEKAGDLSDLQIRMWGLLSIARLVRLGERLSASPGCEVLGELGWAVDTMLRSFQEPPAQEEFQRLMDVCSGLYGLNGRHIYYCGQIEVPGKAPFQIFDLNGMFGVEQELSGYIDDHLRLLSALSQGADGLPKAASSVVGCALLPDYYVRTGTGRLEELPQIEAELERIWSDYSFVQHGPAWAEAARRIEGYERQDILQ